MLRKLFQKKYPGMEGIIIKIAICLLFVIIFTIILNHTRQQKKTSEVTDINIQQYHTEIKTIPLAVPEIIPTISIKETNNSFTEKENQAIAKLKQYKDYNSDVYAWIKIEDTGIDYPVVYTPKDEDYYLRKDLDKKKNSYGVPFMAKGGDLLSDAKNNVIYGHNIRKNEEAMFHDIGKFADIEFYKNHPYITVTTDEGIDSYFIFAYYVIDISEEDAFKYSETTNFINKDEFDLYIKEINKRNWYDTNFVPTYPNSLITLSSCSNESYSDNMGRMVLVGQIINDSFDEKKVMETAKKAKNPILPEK